MYGKETDIENLIRERDHWMENARSYRVLADEMTGLYNSLEQRYRELLEDFEKQSVEYEELKSMLKEQQ